jgi:predicted TPR repeat methyltransferase
VSDDEIDGEIDEERLATLYEAGLAAEKAGDAAAAAEAFRAVIALDPDDRGGAAIRLAALGMGEDPETAPPAYVATLFDQNADNFDEMLVEQLGYHTPMELRERLRARGAGRVARLLDLGCGTGLTGESLRDMAEHVTGVDLSEGMLAMADEKGAYDALFVGDATGFLEASAEDGEPPWDLVVATDVLPYIGALDGLLAAAAACMHPGALLAVSTETMEAAAFDKRGWRVGPKHRYAHADWYIERVAAAAGFTVEAMEPITVRHDEGQPIPGHLVFARRE